MLHCEGATAQTTGVGNSDWEGGRGGDGGRRAGPEAWSCRGWRRRGGRGQRESEEEVEAEADM
jgi:hypothetical protein